MARTQCSCEVQETIANKAALFEVTKLGNDFTIEYNGGLITCDLESQGEVQSFGSNNRQYSWK